MNPSAKELTNRDLFRDNLVLVVGAGVSGAAAARLLHSLGARVRVADSGQSVQVDRLAGLEGKVDLQLGPHHRGQFSDVDLVVLSPGVPRKSLAQYLEGLPERHVVAETELASWFVDDPLIAVTGTNGKTTTTLMIAAMLQAAGKRVFTGGNIGTPLSEYVLSGARADALVVEVSSFQLQTCRRFKPDVAVLLNVAANHLDWHEDMDEYVDAKLNIFARQDETDLAVLPEDQRAFLEPRLTGLARRAWFTTPAKARFEAPALLGAHNRANIEAAWLAAAELGADQESAARAVAAFTPPPHRLQPVAEVDGVLYVDDSKATTLDAVAAAVQSFDRPVRLLLGGVFKGGDVAELAGKVRDKVVQVGLFGAGREVFEPPLAKVFDTFWEPDLDKAVERLARDARPGDVVLLSPATASFDAYTSYAARGDHFQSIVRELDAPGTDRTGRRA